MYLDSGFDESGSRDLMAPAPINPLDTDPINPLDPDPINLMDPDSGIRWIWIHVLMARDPGIRWFRLQLI